MKYLNILLYLIIAYQGAFGQINQGGVPFKIKNSLSNDDIPVYKNNNSQINNFEISKQDIENDKTLTSSRYGFGLKVNINLQDNGKWITLQNGDRLWQLKIVSENALALDIIFNKYHLRDGSKLFVYRPDNKQILGAFTDIDNMGTSEDPRGFSISRLYGEEAIIELYQPKENINKDIIEISEIIHGYRFINTPESLLPKNNLKGFGSSQSCQINVECAIHGGGVYIEREDVRNAVVMILAGGLQFTGCLVNNTKNDGKLYILASDHMISQVNIQNYPLNTWAFVWGYESLTCSNPASDPGFNNKVTIGANLKARNIATDFSLLELIQSPYSLNPPYKAFFCGWDVTPRTNPFNVSYAFNIYHPKGDLKKIAFTSHNLIPDEMTCVGPDAYPINNPSNAYGVRFHEYDQMWSTPEPGASGSPLCLNNGKIIGTLSGIGGSPCDWNRCVAKNEVRVVYGRLSQSWNIGSTPSSRLKDWLDPLNTGVTSFNGGFRDCLSELHINNDPFIWNQFLSSIDAEQIITSSDLMSSNNINRKMQASISITMKDGFHVGASSSGSFKAWISQCNPKVIQKFIQSNNVNRFIEDDIHFPNFTLFPNPTSKDVTIELQNIHKSNVKIMIRDISGRIYATLNQDIDIGYYKNLIDLNDMPNGIYLVTLYTERGYSETKKLIVER